VFSHFIRLCFAGRDCQEACSRLLQCVPEAVAAKRTFGSTRLWQLPGSPFICSAPEALVDYLRKEHVRPELQQLLPQWGAAAAGDTAGSAAVLQEELQQPQKNLAKQQLERAWELLDKFAPQHAVAAYHGLMTRHGSSSCSRKSCTLLAQY
jgi:hypothetical protein